MTDLNTNLPTTPDTEPTQEPNKETAPVSGGTVVTPSIEEVLALLAKAGNDSLMQLAPVKDLVESVRKQEKDKLYKSLETKETEAKELKGQLETALAAIKKQDEDNLTFEQKLQLQIDAVTKQHDDLVATLRAEKAQAEQDKLDALESARKKALEAYQAEKLRLAGDDLILELVGGDTEEEIDASIEKAKAKFAEIAEKLGAKNKKNTADDLKNAHRVTNPTSSGVTKFTADDVKRMSPEEYAKNRHQIMAMMQNGEL